MRKIQKEKKEFLERKQKKFPLKHAFPASFKRSDSREDMKKAGLNGKLRNPPSNSPN